MLSFDPVYPITDSGNRRGWSHRRLARCFLEAGVRLFQVREKALADRVLLEELAEIRRLCRGRGARFVVNDRLDLALAGGADGVHLGQDDLPAAAARRWLGPDAIIGLSTHDPDQFQAALEAPIDYVALGPIFPTSTKPDAHPAVGLETLARLSASSPLPVVAIGGITLETAPQVWRCGAASVAVVSDVTGRADPAGRLQQYLRQAREAAT